MQPLRSWSLARVLLTSAAWWVVSIAGWIYFNVRGYFVTGEGGGVSAVRVDINPVMLAIPFVPPLALVLTWSIVRRRKSI
jgi:hypothetical protein